MASGSLRRRLSREDAKKLTPEQRKARVKALNTANKRRVRRSNKEAIAALRKIDSARCVDLDYLRSFTTETPDRPGCWVWMGKFIASWDRVVPQVTAGQYGRMLAPRAMWLALGRNGMHGKNYPRPACGHFDCVAPDHLQLSNPTLERARKLIPEASSSR